MSKLQTLKEKLKTLACNIHKRNHDLKEFQKDHNGWDGGFYKTIANLAHDYRHKHIAYCLLRGTPYESIEKPREGNEPDMALIKEIQRAYTTDICAGA